MRRETVPCNPRAEHVATEALDARAVVGRDRDVHVEVEALEVCLARAAGGDPHGVGLAPRLEDAGAGTYRGVASGRPPSTGIVAPVVGVCRVAKNRTARATWSAVIRAFRRLRLR